MKIGPLRHRVTLKQPKKTPDDSGGYRTDWDQNDRKLWAEMLVPRFSQQVIQGGLQTSEQVQARVRKRSGARVDDRILWDDGKLYAVTAIDTSRTDYDVLGLKLLHRKGSI